MIYERPICEDCVHQITDKPGAICEAFPEGIPDEILTGINDHSKPLEEQKNELVFTPQKRE